MRSRWYSGGEVGVGVRATEAKLMRSSGGEVGVGVRATEAKLMRSRWYSGGEVGVGDGTTAVKLASASNLRKSSCQDAGTVQLVSSCNPRNGGEVGVGVQAKEAKLMRNRDGEVGVVV
ncbi:hypothetical protein PF004_g3401 [Phytophthora fragariae]|uniref:Uncharacterized protein n=1 Tax=Phytophthora fragariae TaxID=53985 RepID=A0A6G0PLM5_9STRA|nr:hypothetical protein PF004_g3401 [Phytophthora fragariae]